MFKGGGNEACHPISKRGVIMEIQPNTNIKLLHNVPLDNTYDHTIYFSDVSSQTTYFASLVKYNLTAQSYQRVNRGLARVAKCADDIYDCNYMMFQNTSFGNKWFYAFIKSIEYVNNETSEITFEIDDIQTWFFDFTIDRSFVEREHPVSDDLFEHLIDENLELGDYEVVHDNSYDMNSMSIAMLASLDGNLDPPTGQVYDNVYTPLSVQTTTDNTPTAGRALTDPYVNAGREDAIISMYQFPTKFGIAGVNYDDFTFNRQNSMGGGYIPKNKKLYSFPFTKCILTNHDGQTAELRFEDWDSNHVGEFKVAGCGMGQPSALCYPLHYRGLGFDWDSGVSYSNFATVPFAGDTFKAYWAQNKSKDIKTMGLGVAGVLGTAGVIAAGALTGGAALLTGGAALMSGASAVGGVMAKHNDTMAVPPQVHGQVTSDYLNAGMYKNYFMVQQVALRAPFARAIDDYFTKFGYATNRVKIPNTHSRPHWNFVKTISATISGSIPADSARHICQILDTGITYWKNGSEIGRYDLDNSPS